MSNRKILFEPVKIGPLETKNRIVMPPMEHNFATTEGEITDKNIEHYARRAQGGVGFITVEATYIDPTGKGRVWQTGIWHDKLTPSWKRLADAVHKHDVSLTVQLMHAGTQTTYDITGQQPISSGTHVSCVPVCNQVPHPLTYNEIDWIQNKFAEGARRAKEAGLDAVTVHGAHGYIVHQFLSPYMNNRGDKYGGSLENRMRFPLEVVERIKEKVGDNFPILYRMTADDYRPGGLTIDDSVAFCKELEKAGVVCLDISAGIYESGNMIFSYMNQPQGLLRHLSRPIKNAVNIPVMSVGGVVDPEVAEDIVKSGDADLVNVGRALMTDPDWPIKVQEGREDEIRKCIRCKECLYPLLGTFEVQRPCWCFNNPQLGFEKEREITPAAASKKVLVIGGGVGGMETARVAKMRGHDVTLLEKDGVLGGHFRLATKAEHKKEAVNVIKYLETQMNKLNVKVNLNQKADLNTVKSMNPDVVVVATGSNAVIPDVPGANLSHVVTAFDVLDDKVDTKNNILVAGGGLVGLEAAIYLTEKGKKVTVIEMLDDLASDAISDAGPVLMEETDRLKIRTITNVLLKEIKSDSVIIEKLENRRLVRTKEFETIKPVDTVVLAIGASPERTLIQPLIDAGYTVHTVGNCEQIGRGLHAIHGGFFTGLKI
jgi:2,4-dienoyl-CoA reductase-like NADH-dependent reductase (Old Yellow Enzyme family)/thioredoxin reductase